MTFQYLITTVGKSEEDIRILLEDIGIDGEVLLGNQLCKEDRSYELAVGKSHATVFDMTSKGVSKNRNFLLKQATADYVSFFDDDMSFLEGWQQKAEERVLALEKTAVRFNYQSGNPKRPGRQLDKQGYVTWRHLSPFGAFCIYFRREFLLERGLFFCENIGPGTELSHGEDSIFLHDYLRQGTVWSEPSKVFFIKQTSSTWKAEGSAFDLANYLTASGYVYGYVYGRLARAMVFFKARIIRKRYAKDFPSYTTRKIRLGLGNGIRLLKKERKSKRA